MRGERLTATERTILNLCASDNPMGRVGWPLQRWEGGVRQICEPLIHRKLLKERRLGGYPGVEITPKGRRALEEADHAKPA